jgi:hypothetical protein
MPDPVTVTVLAAAAVKLVAPYVDEAAKSGAKKLGELAAGGASALWDKLKARLSSGGSAETLKKVEANPSDPRRWAALELDVEEALEADPTWRAEVSALVEQSARQRGMTVQTASQKGYDNILAQVSGDRNTTTIFGRGQSS